MEFAWKVSAMPEIRAESEPSLEVRSRVRCGAVSARLRRLAQLALVLGLIAGATPAYATPKPDPAPVTPTPPPPTHTFVPPATTSATTTPTVTHKKTTTSPKHKKRGRTPGQATANLKPPDTTLDPQAVGANGNSSGSGSALSSVLGATGIILAGVGAGAAIVISLGIVYLGLRSRD